MIGQRLFAFVVCVLLLSWTGAQQYDYEQQDYAQDYAQDSLYHDYALKQQEKEVTPANFGWSKILVGTTLGWFFGGTIHSRRKEKKLQKKHKEEQKALYTQYYNDVYTLQEQNTELAEALEKLGVRVTR